MAEQAVPRGGRFWLCALWAAGCSFASTLPAASAVRLADADWLVGGHTDLREALLDWHRAWAARDLDGCADLLATDVIRAMQSQTAIEHGRAEVLAALPREWSAFERNADGTLAMRQTLRQVHAEVRDDAALLHYVVESAGGTLWTFDDATAYAALFRRSEDGWQLVFQADAGNLDFDLDTGAAGEPNFSYDYALPVRDLQRALAFYRALLGPPEAVVDGVAAFELSGSRLYLDSTQSAPGEAPQRGLPNGWPIIYPVDRAQAAQRAATAGVEFTRGLRELGGVRLQYGFEPGGTLVALGEPWSGGLRVARPQLEADPAVRGLRLPSALVAAEQAFQQDWLAGDVAALMKRLQPQAVMLEATAARTHGWALDRNAQRARLGAAVPSPQRPQSVVQLGARHTVRAGPWVAIARERTQLGPAPWLRRVRALQSLVYEEASTKIALLLQAESDGPPALALAFDYAGVPATTDGWDATAAALRALTGARSSYTDEGWLGLWGERAVLGIFEADPDTDDLPRERAGGTYLSFWVRDVEAALAFARSSGADLPVVPAINERAGIDRNPGYWQVYLTDSEGNGIVLTQYTGRPQN